MNVDYYEKASEQRSRDICEEENTSSISLNKKTQAGNERRSTAQKNCDLVSKLGAPFSNIMIYGSQKIHPVFQRDSIITWMDHVQFYNVYIVVCYLPVGQFLELNDLNESPH